MATLVLACNERLKYNSHMNDKFKTFMKQLEACDTPMLRDLYKECLATAQKYGATPAQFNKSVKQALEKFELAGTPHSYVAMGKTLLSQEREIDESEYERALVENDRNEWEAVVQQAYDL